MKKELTAMVWGEQEGSWLDKECSRMMETVYIFVGVWVM